MIQAWAETNPTVSLHCAQSIARQGVRLKAATPSQHEMTSNDGSESSDKIDAAQKNGQQPGITSENQIKNALPDRGSRIVRPHAILTSEQAIAIFKLKLAPWGRTRPCASAVCSVYGVSEKAIRDIWKGRTWFEETSRFEPERPARDVRPPGRPKGRKDSAPRRTRQSKSSLCRRDDDDDSSETLPNRTKNLSETSGCAIGRGGEVGRKGLADLCDFMDTGHNARGDCHALVNMSRERVDCQRLARVSAMPGF